MVKNDFCQLWLTIGSKEEADKIGNALLAKRLVACVRQIPVDSDFWWRGKLDRTSEVLLLMESRINLFDKVEKEVAELHSYDTFVLEATPITHLSKSAQNWLQEVLK